MNSTTWVSCQYIILKKVSFVLKHVRNELMGIIFSVIRRVVIAPTTVCKAVWYWILKLFRSNTPSFWVWIMLAEQRASLIRCTKSSRSLKNSMFMLCWPLNWFWSDLPNIPIRLPRWTIAWLIFYFCEFDITPLVSPLAAVSAMFLITTAALTAEYISGSRQTRLGGLAIPSQLPLLLCVRPSAKWQVIQVQQFQSIRYRKEFFTIL